MYRITVTKNEFVRAVYFNENLEVGLQTAKMQHPSCTVVAEVYDEVIDDFK